MCATYAFIRFRFFVCGFYCCDVQTIQDTFTHDDLCFLFVFTVFPLLLCFLTVRVISHGPISLKIVVVLGDTLLKFQYIMNNSTILRIHKILE